MTSPITLKMCPNNLNVCLGFNSLPLLAIMTVSITLNILHIIVLRSLSSLRGKPFLKVLILISIADIVGAITSYAQYLCPLRKYMIGQQIDVKVMLMGITAAAVPNMKSLAVSLGTYDRYLNVCNSNSYANNPVIRHAYIAYMSVCVAVLTAISIVVSLSPEDLCVHTVFGVWYNLDNLLAAIGSSIVNYILFLATIYFVIRTAARLKRSMRELSSINSNLQTDILVAIRYIFVIALLYFASLLLPLTCILIFQQLNIEVEQLDYFGSVFYEMYGILNVVLYGWVSSCYRDQAHALLICQRKNEHVPSIPANIAAVQPSGSVNVSTVL